MGDDGAPGQLGLGLGQQFSAAGQALQLPPGASQGAPPLTIRVACEASDCGALLEVRVGGPPGVALLGRLLGCSPDCSHAGQGAGLA